MAALRTASVSERAFAGLLLGLLLALRLLSPAGFMPAFGQGAVTIIVCPDAEALAPGMAGHHHGGHSKKLHQPCPYAAASSLGATMAELPLLAAMLVVGLALLLGRPLTFVDRHRAYERPPLRGPPLPA